MTTRDIYVKALYLLIVLLAGQLTALASVQGVNLRVVVSDPNGDSIGSARVVIKSGGARERISDTNQQGESLFTGLAPGKHQIHVEAAGFTPRELKDVTLKAGSNEFKVRLAVASIEEEVVVKQDERERQTDPRGDAFTTVLTEAQIANLPDDPDELEAALKRMAGPGAVIRINGFSGGRLPPKSQIRQIRFRRNSYAAEYHEVGLVSVDVITKPGIDSWHGSLSFAFRDEALNARNAFAPRRGAEQLRRFEGTLDAPLWRNRTSLFVAMEGRQGFDSQTIVASLPDGSFAEVVRRPARHLNSSARIVHALSKTHTLSVEYQRNAQRNENLGVGDFDLPERAFSFGQVEHLLRVADAGTLGQRLFNEFRLQLRSQTSEVRSASDAPTVVVLNAFSRGGAQRRSDNSARELVITDDVDFGLRQHAMRAGVLLEAGTYRDDAISNAGGTFTFTSLADFRAASPAVFTQRLGNNPVSFSQYRFGTYLQDDLRVRPNLTLSAGVRYEWQNNLRDHNNFAPRVGLAWSPFGSGRVTVRGGAGIFYDWFGAETLGSILSLDGRRQFELVVRNPGFPDPLGGGTQAGLPPSRSQRDPSLRNPYVGQASLSVETQISRGLRLRTSYVYQRGIHLLRARDINAPVPEVGRPNPEVGNIVQIEATANSRKHLLNLTLNNVFSENLYWFIDYSLSSSISETDGPFSLPADNFNLQAERGPSLTDSRHRLFATAGLKILNGVRLGTTLYATSALPYNITTGGDDNGDTVFNDRPASTSRNSARGAPHWDISMRLSWMLGFGTAKGAGLTQGPTTIRVSSSDVGAISSELAALEKRWRVNLYIQASNLFNHANRINYTGVQSSPFFHQATAALPGRRIETGIRFSF